MNKKRMFKILLFVLLAAVLYGAGFISGKLMHKRKAKVNFNGPKNGTDDLLSDDFPSRSDFEDEEDLWDSFNEQRFDDISDCFNQTI